MQGTRSRSKKQGPPNNVISPFFLYQTKLYSFYSVSNIHAYIMLCDVMHVTRGYSTNRQTQNIGFLDSQFSNESATLPDRRPACHEGKDKYGKKAMPIRRQGVGFHSVGTRF